MNQLAEAGIPAWKILSETLGVTQAQAQKLAESGQVSAKVFLDAFQQFSKANYGGLMDAQSKTFLGALSNIKDGVQQFLGTAMQPLFEVVRNIAVRLGDLASNGQLQRWALQAQQVVRALISTMGELLAVIGTVARGIASVFGITLPSFSIGGAAATAAAPHVAAAAPASTAATATNAGQADAATAAQQNLDAVKGQLDDLRDKQDALNDSIKDTKQHYEDLIAPVQRQLDVVNKLSDAEKARQVRLDELTGQEIQIKLAIPYDQIATLDGQINELKRKKEDLGRFDASGYDNLIRPLQAQSEAYSKTIQGIQEQIAAIGQDHSLERRIQDLQQILGAPAVDTHGFSNQLIGIQAQQVAGGNAGALDAQRRAVSLQMQAAVQGDLDKRSAAQTELQQLQERKILQDRMDQDHKDALDQQIKAQEKQKAAVDEQAKVWEQAKQDAQAAFQAQGQAIDDQITKLSRQKDDLLAPSQAALAQVDAEKNILSLQQQQDDLRRKMLAQPLKDQIDAIKQAEQDALDPLTKQTAEYEKQQHALDAQERSLQKIAAGIKKGADAGGGGGGAAADTTPFPTLADVAPGTNKVAEAIDNVNNKLKEFEQWWKDHVTPALQEAHRVLVADVIPALGHLKDALGEAKDALKDVYDWLQPKLVAAFDAVTDAGKRLTDWLGQIFNPLLGDAKKILDSLMPVLQDLSPLVGTQLKTDFFELEIVMTPVEVTLKEIGFYADTVLKPILVGLSDMISNQLSANLTALHLLLTNFVNPALNTVGDTITKTVTPAVEDIATKIDTFTTKLGDLKNWVEQNWADVGTKLAAPFTSAWDKIKEFFGNLYTGVKWLADHFGLSAPAAPSFLSADNGQSSGGSAGSFAPAPGGGGGTGKAANGLLNAAEGHWSWVGEEGPEMMYVPKGSSILPNRLSKAMAGHADGFNVDAIFNPLGAVVAGTAGKFVDALMDKLPGVDLPGVAGGGAAMLKEIATGLKGWLANAPGNIAQQVTAGVTGAMLSPPMAGAFTPGQGNWHNPVPGIRAVQGSWTHGGTHDHEAAVDWAAPYGTSILAPDSGSAYTVWNGDGQTGRTGVIDHGNGWLTYYGHVSDFANGAFNQDAVVGHTGSPERDGGAGSGAHLHFAMRLNGAYERPEDYIPGIFGLAGGGISIGGQSRLVMVGDGPTGQREFHTPEPDLRQIVRDESSAMQIESGAFTFHIHPTPGMSEERVAELAAEAVHDVMIRGPQQRGRAA
jgi:murein DD-endopeptidase MepM/ murein hydrolase activator NlpD